MSDENPVRGSNAVKAALVEAACDMLAEVGPRTLSIRNVAERAGVNHGQIHHYFGGKRGLLRAAMAYLAAEHWEKALVRAVGAPAPPTLSLKADARYWQATCRAVIEGDLDLAQVEIDEGFSVPQRVFATVRERNEIAEDDLDAKANFAFLVMGQLGWVAFEEYLVRLVDVKDEDRVAFRERVKNRLDQTAVDLFGVVAKN